MFIIVIFYQNNQQIQLVTFRRARFRMEYITIILIVIVSKSKVILFGGATGDTGKYIITGDTYGLDLISYKWTKLEGTNSALQTLPGNSAMLVKASATFNWGVKGESQISS